MLGRDTATMARSYRSISHILASGVGIVEGLNVIRNTASTEDLKKIMHIKSRLSRGMTLTATLRSLRYPALDLALIDLGEETGSLPNSLKFLGDAYDQRAQLERAMQAAALLPVLLICFSILLKRLAPLINGTITGSQYLAGTGLSLAIFGAIVGAGYRLMRNPNQYPQASQWLSKIGERTPRLGDFLRELAMYRFFSGLYVCTRAGYDIRGTFALAGSMTSNTQVRRAAVQIPKLIVQHGLAGALTTYQAQETQHSRRELFTTEQITQILVGEESGRLEQCLEEITRESRVQIEISVGYFKDWAPRILYGICMAYVILF